MSNLAQLVGIYSPLWSINLIQVCVEYPSNSSGIALRDVWSLSVIADIHPSFYCYNVDFFHSNKKTCTEPSFSVPCKISSDNMFRSRIKSDLEKAGCQVYPFQPHVKVIGCIRKQEKYVFHEQHKGTSAFGFFWNSTSNYTLNIVQNHDQLFEPQKMERLPAYWREITSVYHFHKATTGWRSGPQWHRP